MIFFFSHCVFKWLRNIFFIHIKRERYIWSHLDLVIYIYSLSRLPHESWPRYREQQSNSRYGQRRERTHPTNQVLDSARQVLDSDFCLTTVSSKMTTPLLQDPETPNANNGSPPTPVSGPSDVKQAIRGFLKGFEQVLDWSPFIVVSSLQGNYSPTVALGWGTLTGAALVLYKWIIESAFGFGKNDFGMGENETPNKWFPKTLDLGQFLLFGLLFLSAFLLKFLASDQQTAHYIEEMLGLWLTTGGMALIMWVSILREQSFVYDYVKNEMPLFIYKRFKIGMTLVVTMHPLLVTFCYGGYSDLAPNWVNQMGNIFTVGQFFILAYGMVENGKESGKAEKIKNRVKEAKEKMRRGGKFGFGFHW